MSSDHYDTATRWDELNDIYEHCSSGRVMILTNLAALELFQRFVSAFRRVVIKTVFGEKASDVGAHRCPHPMRGLKHL